LSSAVPLNLFRRPKNVSEEGLVDFGSSLEPRRTEVS